MRRHKELAFSGLRTPMLWRRSIQSHLCWKASGSSWTRSWSTAGKRRFTLPSWKHATRVPHEVRRRLGAVHDALEVDGRRWSAGPVRRRARREKTALKGAASEMYEGFLPK